MAYKTAEFFTVGKQFKRVFISFLVSNFVFFLQVWFGMELNKLANNLRQKGIEEGYSEFKEASRRLEVTRSLAYVAFVGGIVLIAVMVGGIYWLFSNLFSMSFSFDPTQLMVTFLILILIFMIPIILELASLGWAWKSVHDYFVNHTSSSTPSGALGLKSTARVSWGSQVSIASLVVVLAILIIFSLGFTNIFEITFSTIYQFLILLLVLLIIAGLLGTLGTINVGVGIFDTAKVFMNYSDIQWRMPEREWTPTPSRNKYRDLPYHPDQLAEKRVIVEKRPGDSISKNNVEEISPKRKWKYCPSCGGSLPDVEGLRFCAYCGLRVN